MLTRQKDIKDSIFTVLRDYWGFIILIGPSGICMILFISKMVEIERRALLQMFYDRTKEQREYQTILENLDSGILTMKETGVSYFNAIAKEFMLDAAQQNPNNTQKHEEAIEEV
jgi:hypothetical protein